jgi:hypothetical protein
MRIEINSVSKVMASSLAFVLVAPSVGKVCKVAVETYREAEVWVAFFWWCENRLNSASLCLLEEILPS